MNVKRLRKSSIAGFVFVSFTACLLLTSRALWASEKAGEYDPKIDLWPIVFYSHDKEKNNSILEIFGRFVEKQESETHSQFFIRPVYRQQIDKKKKEKQTQFLWPLGWSTERPGFKSERFWPIYFHEQKRLKTGKQSWNTTVFPVYFNRKEPGQPEDFGVFPFYGRFYKRFGVDYGIFILWPFYVEMDKGKSKTVNVPWPFLGFTWGGGRSAFKLWPFFGSSKGPRYEKKFICWPFFSEMKFTTKGGKTHKKTMLFPFYAVADGPNGKSSSVLWPFFKHEQNTKEGYERWTLPWPFVIQSKGTREENTFWPFWVNKKTKGIKR